MSMKVEAVISKNTANHLYALINNAIQEEQNFPSHEGDEWMNSMIKARDAIGEADRIEISDGDEP